MRKRDLMSRASEDFDHMWSKVDRQVIQRRFRIPRWKNLIAWALVNLRKQRLVAGRGSKLYLLDSRYISQRLIRWAVSGRRKRLRKIKIGPHSLRKQLRRTVLTK